MAVEFVSHAKFLVLSGDLVTRDLIAVLLKNRGYRDTVAADPSKVDAMLGSQKFLAVFADARPMHSVADFQALIARLGRDTKLVLLVDENGSGVIDAAMAGKADAVLPYPFEDAMIERVLGQLTDE
jgi:CheY-like chemotaxis protein